jgi:hypothetical protein
MSKVSGRTGPSFGKEQARRPDERFLRKRAFEKRTLPEPPRLKRPKTYLLGRSPLRAFYYTKGARGKWHTARRVTDGTGWNAFLCSGTAIPRGTAPAIYQMPPAVSGLLRNMKALNEKAFSAGHTIPHEVHVTSAHAQVMEVRQQTMHAHSGTGWVDVPMPGMKTQYQQGSLVHPDIAPKHHGTHSHWVQVQPQVPAAMISMATAQMELAPPAKHTNHQVAMTLQDAAPVLQESVHDYTPEMRAREPRGHETSAPEARNYEAPVECAHAPASIHLSEPLQLHFSAVRSERPHDAHAEKTASRKTGPQHFHADAPKLEGILKAPEYRVQAAAAPLEYRAQSIGIEHIPVPAHIGYIPSVKKKEIQLKVAQGAGAVPPQ